MLGRRAKAGVERVYVDITLLILLPKGPFKTLSAPISIGPVNNKSN